jgi:hypothetical protein
MPCRHIFGDLDSEAIGLNIPLPAHPKAEKLFGQIRLATEELERVGGRVETKALLPTSRH